MKLLTKEHVKALPRLGTVGLGVFGDWKLLRVELSERWLKRSFLAMYYAGELKIQPLAEWVN